MKRTKLFYLFLAFVAMFTIACDDDEISYELVLSHNEVSLLMGEDATVGVKVGNGGYAVKSENSDIATAVLLEGNSVGIAAVKPGTTTVNVTDSKGKKAMIKVTVKALLELEKEAVTLQAGETALVGIVSGSGKYDVMSSKKEVATATIEDNKVKVVGAEKGEATITVTDKDTKVKKEIKVVVKPVLDIENADVIVIEGEVATVAIKDGTGKYTVSSSDESIAKATVSENEVKIEGVSTGNATITLTDSDTQNVKEIKVAVKSTLALEKDELTVKEGETAPVTIIKGTGSYEATSSNADVATVKLEGETINVTGVAKGEATITVKDTDTKKEKTIKVTVVAELRLSKKELTLDQDATEKVAVLNVQDDAYEFMAEPSDILSIEKGKTDYEGKSVDALVIKALKYSKENVKVTVKSGDQEAVLNVTVNAVEAIKLEKKETTLNVGSKEEVKILAGNGDYKVEVDNANVVGAEVKQNKTSYVVVLDAKAEGVANVKLTDAAGKSATLKVTVNSKPGNDDGLFNIDSDGLVYKKEGVELVGDLKIPDEGKKIAEYSSGEKTSPFAYLGKITSIDFNNVTDLTATNCVSKCKDLTTVYLRKVTAIGIAFYYCTNLKEVYCYMETPPSISFSARKSAFKGISADAILYVPKGTLDAYSNSRLAPFFKEIKEMEAATPEADVEIDADGLVYKKEGVELEGDVKIPDAGKKIAEYSSGEKTSPFAYLGKITSIDFNNVTDLTATNCVSKCKDLTTVHLRKVTAIGIAFYYCTNLKEVYCYMETPPSISFSARKSAFKGISADAILYVPKGTLDAYSNSRLAPFFKEIKEM